MAVKIHLGSNNWQDIKSVNIHLGSNNWQQVRGVHIHKGGDVWEKIWPQGIPLTNKNIGDIIKIPISGVQTDFIIVHKGNPNIGVYDISYNNGIIVLMKNIYSLTSWGVSTNPWRYDTSTIHNFANTTIYNSIDASVRSLIKQVKVPYRAGYSASSPQSLVSYIGVNGVSSYVFTLDAIELGFYDDNGVWSGVDGEGQPWSVILVGAGDKLDYFTLGDSAGASSRIALYSGSPTSWWSRSMSYYYADIGGAGQYQHACYVTNSGTFGIVIGTTNTIGIRPAMVLPDNILVDDNGLILLD